MLANPGGALGALWAAHESGVREFEA